MRSPVSEYVLRLEEGAAGDVRERLAAVRPPGGRERGRG